MELSLISRANNPTGMTVAEVEHDIAQCSGFVKMMSGVANNCAYIVMMEALARIRKHPRYADKKIRRLFEDKPNSALDFYKRYRNRLRWPMGRDLRLFHVKELTEEARRKYGEPLTDEQFFEFWESSGNLAYEKSQPWITSLWNKFRLSLLQHDVPYPEIAAWGLVGSSVLELAVEIWDRAMRSVHEAVPVLPIKTIHDIYSPFNMQQVATAWHKACRELTPETESYRLDEIEEKNISMGLNQLRELWISPDLPFDATIASVEDYKDEIFRSDRQAKKSILELKKMRKAAIEDIEEQKREERMKQHAACKDSQQATVPPSSTI